MSDATEPRSIKKSPGSRIRHLQLGRGDEFMVVFDWDNGHHEYQTNDWCFADEGVRRQVDNCDKKGRDIKVIGWKVRDEDYDYMYDEEDLAKHHWYIYAKKPNGTGDHAWWSSGNPFGDYFRGKVSEITITAFGKQSAIVVQGRNGFTYKGLDEALVERIKRMNKEKKAIHNICLSQCRKGGYWIKDDEGTAWKNLGANLSKELKNRGALHVCEGPDGAWVVLRDQSFVSSTGVPKRLDKNLGDFYRDQRNYQAKRSRDIKAFRDAKAEALHQKSKADKRKREEEEKKRKRELAEEEAHKKKRRMNELSVSYLYEARYRADLHDYREVSINARSRLVSFCRGDVRINVYYTTGTVGTCLKHPYHAIGTQLFRRNVTATELAAIFENPRVHTGKGYFRFIAQQSSSTYSTISTRTAASTDGTPEREALQMYYNKGEDFAQTSTEFERAGLILQMEAASDLRSKLYENIRLERRRVFTRTLIIREKGIMGYHAKKSAQTMDIECFNQSSAPSVAKDAGLKLRDTLHLVTVPVCGQSHLSAMCHKSGRNGMAVGLQCSRAGETHHFAVITDSDAKIGVVCEDVLVGGPIRVTCDDKTSPAYVAGIRTGDIITHITVPIQNTGSYKGTMSPLTPGTVISVLASRAPEPVVFKVVPVS